MIVNFNCYQQFQGEEEKVGIVEIIAANELYGQILDRCAKGMPAVSGFSLLERRGLCCFGNGFMATSCFLK